MAEDMKRYAFTVSGKVQGVFFRKFAQQKARDLNLVGFVRNTHDGDVAGEAQGSEEALKEFKKHLNEGSRHSQVARVQVAHLEVKEEEQEFEIRRR